MKATALKAYAVVVTIAIIIVLSYRSGYDDGIDDAKEKVNAVLERTATRAGSAWDEMNKEFN